VERYIGTKIIEAEPMTSEEYNEAIRPLFYSGNDKRGYKVKYEDGYISWSPKDVFEKAYRATTGMTFGLAIEAVKAGKKIARTGWNGKGMFVVYQKGYPQGIPSNAQTAKAWGIKEGELFKCEPYLQIKMVNGSHSMWVPSINDVLADDWEIVEG
jgi:hypothetical protein